MKKIYELFEGHSIKSKVINSSIAALIVLNIIAVILDSFSSISTRYSAILNIFEAISIIVFSIEYVLRIISSPYKNKDSFDIKLVLKYIISPLALIDLLSILPFYLPLLFKMDLRFIRIIRVFRLVRVLKIKRYSKSLDIIAKVLYKKRTDLILTIVIIGILILMSGSIMYYVENEYQPNVFPNIIESSFWSLKTMVFLGYEVPPISNMGKFIGLITTLLGLGWIAMPISIISSGFVEEINIQKNTNNKYCPYCGKELPHK
jgi:voltage-gated potassium channel